MMNMLDMDMVEMDMGDMDMVDMDMQGLGPRGSSVDHILSFFISPSLRGPSLRC